MTEPEVAAARAKMAEAAAGIFPPVRRKFRPTWWSILIIVLLGLELTRMRHSHGHDYARASEDTIDYQGQQFKMRKAYASYEDYKDDPDNLNTNELDRIEQAMTSAKIPSNYKDWPAFVHVLIFDLAFPGYGSEKFHWRPAPDRRQLKADRGICRDSPTRQGPLLCPPPGKR